MILDVMAERHSYLREWRKKKALTQRQVVDRLAIFDDKNLPRTEASLSRIESGKQPYSQRVIEALAEVYQAEPGELLSRDPQKEGRLIDMVSKLNERQQAQAMAVIEALLRDAAIG